MIREISRDTCKLDRTPMLIKKKKKEDGVCIKSTHLLAFFYIFWEIMYLRDHPSNFAKKLIKVKATATNYAKL